MADGPLPVGDVAGTVLCVGGGVSLALTVLGSLDDLDFDLNLTDDANDDPVPSTDPNPDPWEPGRPPPPIPVDPDCVPGIPDDCNLDHIVLGLEAYGLRQTAARVGGRHLLDDPSWRYTFLEALGDPSVRFTVALDGLDGVNATEQLRTAVSRGASGSPSPTNWEIAQLHQAGRLSTTSLVQDRGQRSVPNPWPAMGFPP